MGDNRTEFGRLDTGATDMIDAVVSMRRGPLGQPNTRGDEGDSIDRAGVQAKVKGAGLTGAASALAAGSVGDDSVSDTGGKGACMRGDGAGGV